jgi:hypothetical protein
MHPWLASLLLGTVATPAAVILAIPAPRPLDAVLAWPLVLADSWWGPGANVGSAAGEPYASVVHLLAFAAGVAFTWMFYVFLARLVLWRVAATGAKAS